MSDRDVTSFEGMAESMKMIGSEPEDPKSAGHAGTISTQQGCESAFHSRLLLEKVAPWDYTIIV